AVRWALSQADRRGDSFQDQSKACSWDQPGAARRRTEAPPKRSRIVALSRAPGTGLQCSLCDSAPSMEPSSHASAFQLEENWEGLESRKEDSPGSAGWRDTIAPIRTGQGDGCASSSVRSRRQDSLGWSHWTEVAVWSGGRTIGVTCGISVRLCTKQHTQAWRCIMTLLFISWNDSIILSSLR
ncbi:hypothetical protein COCON_G00220230, partial [Conger conger]